MRTNPRDPKVDPSPPDARRKGPVPLDPALLRHVAGGQCPPAPGPKGTWSPVDGSICGPKGTC